MKKKYIIPTCEVYSMMVENNLMDISFKDQSGKSQDYAPDSSEPEVSSDGYIEFYSKKHHGFSAWDTWDD